MAKSGEATKKSKKIGRQIGRPRGAKNRVRSVPSKASVLKSIWQRAERAKGTELGTELYIELVKLYEKVRLADKLADKSPRPRGTQPDSQKGRRDAAQQAKSDAKAAARAAFGKGLAVPELSTHLSPSTGPQEPVAQPEPPLPPEDRIDRDARKQAESDAAARERSRLESIRYLTACGVLHGHEGAARESAVRVSVHPIPIDAAPPSVPNENTDIRPPEAPKAPNTTVAVISPEEWERMKASVHR
jgi:hypothetical protein